MLLSGMASVREKEMPVTTTYDDEELLAGFDEPLRCECEHRARPCGSDATHRVVIVCEVEDCEDAAGVYLLCRACMQTWRREVPYRLRITPL